MNQVSLLKDAEHGLITIGVGNQYATMTLGEWSKVIASPRMYVRPTDLDTSPSEMPPEYSAPPEDCA